MTKQEQYEDAIKTAQRAKSRGASPELSLDAAAILVWAHKYGNDCFAMDDLEEIIVVRKRLEPSFE